MIKIDLTKIASHKTPIFPENLRKTSPKINRLAVFGVARAGHNPGRTARGNGPGPIAVKVCVTLLGFRRSIEERLWGAAGDHLDVAMGGKSHYRIGS